MQQSRIPTLLGPAAVLYLVAEVASSAGGVSVSGWGIALAAIALSLVPLRTRRMLGTGGEYRVSALALCTAGALLVLVEPSARSSTVEVVSALGQSSLGAIVLDLSLTVPLRRHARNAPRAPRVLVWLAASAAGGLGVLAAMQPLGSLGATSLVRVSASRAPGAVVATAVAVSALMRLATVHRPNTPEERAAGTWALVGLIPAVLAGAFLSCSEALGVHAAALPPVRGALAATAVLLVVCHVAMIDPRKAVHAGKAARTATAAGAALAVTASGAAAVAYALPREAVGAGLAAAAALLVGAGFYRLVLPVVDHSLAPHGGRLLAALARTTRSIGRADRVEDLARDVLGELRTASADPSAMPLLITVAPALELWLDAAGEPHTRHVELPPPLLQRLVERPGQVVVREDLEAQAVRSAQDRPVLDALAARDALCVVPLTVEGELEGALVVPRGRRRCALALDELAALDQLGRQVSGLVAVMSAHARSEAREALWAGERAAAADKLDSTERELLRLRSDVRVLRAGTAAGGMGAPPVCYSEPMRIAVDRARMLAADDGPVLLVSEGDMDQQAVGRLVHDASSRAQSTLVIADCASVSLERCQAALCGQDGGEDSGEDTHPGWLRLAAGGSLLLTDVLALPSNTQQALCAAITSRVARPLDSTNQYQIDARVIATSRLLLGPLVETGAFDAGLGELLSSRCVSIPPLRQRREDLPSLVLLALDRACRVLGREATGIEPAALDVLVAHDWPGNLRELQSVIDRAVARTMGHQIRVADLPSLARGQMTA